MRKLTGFVVAMAIALTGLAFLGTPARGSQLAGPTVTATAKVLGNQLTWSYDGAAAGFLIRKGETAGHEDRWPVTDFPVVGNAWLDEEITPGKTYYYVVTPVFQDGGQGFDSIEVSVTAAGAAADRRLVHFHMDADQALIRTAAGDEAIALVGKPLIDHSRVLLALEDVVALTGADLTQAADGKAITFKLPNGRVMSMELEKCALLFGKAARPDACHPLEHGGHTYVPLRWIVEGLEGTLSFNPLDGSVTFEVAR